MAMPVAESQLSTDTAPIVDRVAFVIVSPWQAQGLVDALIAHSFSVSMVDATGGLLRRGAITLLVGLPAKRLGSFFSLVRDICPDTTRYIPYDAEEQLPWRPECELVEVRTGGATTYVIAVEQFVQL